MRLKSLELHGFKSFAHKTVLEFSSPITAIVGPNGSGKSNVVEALRFVLGEQSMKSMRSASGADLIFKGSRSLSKSPRARVAVCFDNADRVFRVSGEEGEGISLDFDSITIAREVYPDGLSRYVLNGSEARLRDILNILASINIGSSGHHIISQGEADRILRASPRERKEMVEDALGLKIYQYRIREAERKLERARRNMEEVAMLRRENAPHLAFLRRQVEKLEQAREIALELSSLAMEYFSKEKARARSAGRKIGEEERKLSEEANELSGKIAELENKSSPAGSGKLEELSELEGKLAELSFAREELERRLGRTEGMIEAKENRFRVSGRCPLCGNILKESDEKSAGARQTEEDELIKLKSSREETSAAIAKNRSESEKITRAVSILKEEILAETGVMREMEKQIFALKVRMQEVSSSLAILRAKREALSREEEILKEEVNEIQALLGESFVLPEPVDGVEAGEPEEDAAREERRRKMERLKIKLEDSGLGSGAEVRKEFEEASERDRFLEREMGDLSRSADSVLALGAELRKKVASEFSDGVKKINAEFTELFALMFGGGSARLLVSSVERKSSRAEMGEDGEDREYSGKDEEERKEGESPEEGIEIDVSLPRKKVRHLDALSGGERSLVSIALLFAMSRVHPPPFLVLDETDAALDEANSRRYGDMLEKLSTHSELILVTHNRETMSRSGVLYGVTVGSDGASKFLSVRLDEAVAIAK